MISLRDTEAVEARDHEGKGLQLLGIPIQCILWLHGLEDLSSVCPLIKPMMPNWGLILNFPDTEGLCKPQSHLCPCTGRTVLDWVAKLGELSSMGTRSLLPWC